MYPPLADDEIHVWRIDLCAGHGTGNRFFGVLSAEEKARANRFRYSRDRETFSTCRGVLRHILGDYLGVRPEEVKFSIGPYGKPQLDEPYSGTTLQFNVSHSRGVGLIAITRGMAGGIDVECVRPLPEAEGIAETHFSSKEREGLSRLPGSKMAEGFFACWTRKEAFVKAQGCGLSIPLNSFCVSTRPGEVVDLRDACGNSNETLPWKVMDLRFNDIGVSDTYVGALVGQGTGWHASVRKWQLPRQLLPASMWRE